MAFIWHLTCGWYNDNNIQTLIRGGVKIFDSTINYNLKAPLKRIGF